MTAAGGRLVSSDRRQRSEELIIGLNYAEDLGRSVTSRDGRIDVT